MCDKLLKMFVYLFNTWFWWLHDYRCMAQAIINTISKEKVLSSLQQELRVCGKNSMCLGREGEIKILVKMKQSLLKGEHNLLHNPEDFFLFFQ